MPIAQLMPLPVHWPYLPAIERLSLALALGLFVGLERQWRRKEAGLRTFGLASLLGCMGGLLGPGYALMGLGLLGLLVIFLNVQSLLAGQGTELTTSVALLVTGFTGVFCGLGHTLTPVAVSVVSAALLAWKEPMAGFSIGLTEAELRSAILLAILAFVIYPALPAGAVDPWGLVDLRTAWVTVLLIAGIGFANYVLLKLYGARGIELTGFLGGLVNSTVTVAELAGRVGETPELAEVAYRGVMIATAAMVVRNAALLALLAPRALITSAPALVLMLAASAALSWSRGRRVASTSGATPSLMLQSPFSLQATLKFGLIFLDLQVAGTLAQRALGRYGFYAVSLAGGLISSASVVASAGSLAAHGAVPVEVAGTGAVLASLTSALVNLPLVLRTCRGQRLAERLAWGIGIVVALGVIGAVAGARGVPMLLGQR
jgi:uncharacterized membrane protein (DUF4010 family)